MGCSMCSRSEDEELMNSFMNELPITNIHCDILSNFILEQINTKSKSIEETLFLLEKAYTKSEKYLDVRFLVSYSYMNIDQVKRLFFSLGFLCKKNDDKLIAYLLEIDKIGTGRKFFTESKKKVYIRKEDLVEILLAYTSLVSKHLANNISNKSNDPHKFVDLFNSVFDEEPQKDLVVEILNKYPVNIDLETFIDEKYKLIRNQRIREELVNMNYVRHKMEDKESKLSDRQ